MFHRNTFWNSSVPTSIRIIHSSVSIFSVSGARIRNRISMPVGIELFSDVTRCYRRRSLMKNSLFSIWKIVFRSPGRGLRQRHRFELKWVKFVRVRGTHSWETAVTWAVVILIMKRVNGIRLIAARMVFENNLASFVAIG